MLIEGRMKQLKLKLHLVIVSTNYIKVPQNTRM